MERHYSDSKRNYNENFPPQDNDNVNYTQSKRMEVKQRNTHTQNQFQPHLTLCPPCPPPRQISQEYTPTRSYLANNWPPCLPVKPECPPTKPPKKPKLCKPPPPCKSPPPPKECVYRCVYKCETEECYKFKFCLLLRIIQFVSISLFSMFLYLLLTYSYYELI